MKHSAIKGNEVSILVHANTDKLWKDYAKWKEPVTKDHILYNLHLYEILTKGQQEK